VSGWVKRDIGDEFDPARAGSDERGRSFVGRSDESGCTLYPRPDESVEGDRAESVRSGMSVAVSVVLCADAYNSISSVPSAIKTRAATMAACYPKRFW
jgi:hypothetical protein